MYTDEQRRSHIFDLQTFLRRIQRAEGHAQPLVPDGVFGPETAEAVRAFQRAGGLPVTGTADHDTWTAVYQAYQALAAAGCAAPRRGFSSPRARTPRCKAGTRGRACSCSS